MDPHGQTAGATHRYGRVLLGTVVVVIAIIVLPDDGVGRGVGLVLQALLLTMVTVAARDARSRAITATGVAAAVFGGVAADVPGSVVLGLSGALAAIMVWTVARGVVAHVRASGVTPQAVAGGLALYLLIGLAFSYIIGAVAQGAQGPYFAQGTDGTSGQRIYFSFTAMTTTGFGDLTPRTDVGRSLTVLEMLIGQIYLVVVVALLVGNLRRRDG
jgi:hypothetical protein